jgi:hypothetical protein
MNNLTHSSFFYMFISVLYMFRATLCSSPGESNVSIQHLVCVTLCRWPSIMQVGKLTVHLSIILVNDQLDAQFFFSIYLFQFSTCFEQPRAHNQENQLYQYNIWYVSLCVGDRHVRRSRPAYMTVTYKDWHIPDVVLIELNLLMMSTRLLETCRELK